MSHSDLDLWCFLYALISPLNQSSNLMYEYMHISNFSIYVLHPHNGFHLFCLKPVCRKAENYHFYALIRILIHEILLNMQLRIKLRKSIILSIQFNSVHAYISDDQHETGQTFPN